MPGIAGIISRKKSPDECQRLVADMTRSMMHERFYVSGTHSFPELGIHGGWVAHENSFAADQVFWNEQKDVALLFAGECFIDLEVRTELLRKGHALGSGAGGWLVHLYEEKGDGFFESLNGLFSGLLIDRRRGRAFLFNDRYGIERLYWHETNEATYFASEAKALLRVLPELRAFDEEGVAQFLSFGCTLDWKTLFRGVRLAPGGTLWTIENGACRKAQYFTPAKWEAQPALTEAEFEAKFAETFQRVLPRYFESASRVGISLTGGLDTRMIMASLPKRGEQPVSYTFGGVNGATLDERIARRVAGVCGLSHDVLKIGPEFFANFGAYTDRTVYNTDGCFGALGSHEIYFHEQARERSVVRLTGNFGSEVLRSMSTFKPIGLETALFNPDFARAVNGCGRRLAGGAENPVTFAAFKEIPWNLFGSLAAGRSQLTFRTPYLDNEIVALAFQAPAAARTSPEPAVRYVKQANPALGAIATDRGLAGSDGKFGRALRRVFSEVSFKLDYLCSEGLPHGFAAFDSFYLGCGKAMGVSGLHKFLQYRRWLQRELAAFVEARVVDSRLPFWNERFIESMAREHISGRRNYSREINAVITLGALDRMVLRGAPGTRTS